jgi:hypothetical protein
MISKIRAFIDYVKTWFQKAMETPDVNSRLVFLAHGLGSTLCLLILTIAFVAAKQKESYPAMVLAVSGGSGVAAVGRFLTKKGSSSPVTPAN